MEAVVFGVGMFQRSNFFYLFDKNLRIKSVGFGVAFGSFFEKLKRLGSGCFCFFLLLSPLSLCCESYSIYQNDEQRRISIEIGDTLEIYLEENSSTGYIWELDHSVEKWLHLFDKTMRKTKQFPGAPYTCIFRFIAVQSGTCDLVFCYRRPWEKGDPVKIFSVTVIIDQGRLP